MKEHDWVGENLANPNFTNSDFKAVGVTAQNTSIGPESVYLKADAIRTNPEFQTNGVFDQTKFHKKYEQLVVSYNKLAQDTYEDDLLNQGRIFDYNNILVSPEERKLQPETSMGFEVNPDHISKGIVGVNQYGPRTMTPLERAEGQKIFDPATGKFTEDTPESSFFKNFFKPIVVATWDFDADANGKPTSNPEEIVYRKGEYKLNEDGEYYPEFLNGRSPYDKQIISKWDILTPEGSTLNNFDMFDSDDIDKSTGGSIMRNALKIAPFFVEEIAPFYAAVSLGINLADALGTLGKLVLGSENKTLNTLTGFTSQFNQSTSEFGQQHTFSLENILNMVGDTFVFLKSQRILAENAPRLFMGKVPKDDDEFRERAAIIADEWIKDRKKLLNIELANAKARKNAEEITRLATALNMDTELTEAGMSYANNMLRNQMATFNNLGRQISTSTMAVTFGLHTYGHAKAQGVSDTAATALTLGAIAGQYALLSSHIGQHIFPEAQIYNKRLETAINKVMSVEEAGGKPIAEVSKNIGTVNATGKIVEKQAQTLNLMQKGWKLAQEMWKVQSTPTKATIASTAAQGVEMASFTALDDVIASIYNLSQYISGSDHRMNAWNDIAGRYGSALLGGAIAGAIGAGGIYKQAKALREMSDEAAFHTILYTINEDKIDSLFRTIDNMELGNKYLSGTKQYRVMEDGKETVYWDMGTEEDNQDALNKKVLKDTILEIRDILQVNGAKLNKNSLLGTLIGTNTLLHDYRLNALLNSKVTVGYLQEFLNNQYKMVKSGLLLSKDPAIKKQLGISDPMSREIRDELKETEQNPNAAVSAEGRRHINAQKSLSEAIEFNRKFISGEISKEYIPDAIFELTPGLHFYLLNEGFRSFVKLECNDNTPIEKLSESTRKSYEERYKNSVFGKGNGDKIYFMRRIFDPINKAMQPVLKKGLIERSESVNKFLSLFDESYANQQRGIAADIEDNTFYNSDLQHKAKFGMIVDKLLDKSNGLVDGTNIHEFAAFIKNLSDELLTFGEKISAYKQKMAESGIVLTIDDIYGKEIEGIEVPEMLKAIYDAYNANQIYYTDGEAFVTAMTQMEAINGFIESLWKVQRRNLGRLLLPKLQQFIEDNIAGFGFIDYSTRLELNAFAQSLKGDDLVNTGDMPQVRYLPNEANPSFMARITIPKVFSEPMAEFSGKDILLRELSTFDDTFGAKKQEPTRIAELLGLEGENQRFTLDDWQIIETLDNTISTIDGEDAAFSIKDIMMAVEQQYRDLEEQLPFYDLPGIDLSRFILDPNTVVKLERVLQLTNVLRSTLIAAEDEIDARYDMFGYNATLNKLLELQGDEQLAVIDPNHVHQRMLAISNVQSRINTLLEISKTAQSQKWGNSQKIDLNYQAHVICGIRDIFFREVNGVPFISTLADHQFDDGTKFEGVMELRDALNSALQLQSLVESPNNSPKPEVKHQGRREFFQVLKAFNTFFKRNKAIVDSPKKLSYLINYENFKNLGAELENYKAITQDEAPVDDMALLTILKSAAALDPSVFWSNLAKNYPKNRLPVEVQHIMAWEATSFWMDFDNIHQKFDDAYNESLKARYDTNTEQGMFDYVQNVLSSSEVQKYPYVFFAEAGPGFGKSIGVTPLALHMTKILWKEMVKNAWIYKPSKPKEIVKKLGLSKEELDSLNIQLFSQGEANTGKLAFMDKMFTNYKQPKIDGKTMEMVVSNEPKEIDTTTMGIKSDTEIRIIPEANKPKIIVIDEFTDISEGEWLDINRFAKANGIKVLSLGDFYQSGIKAALKEKVNFNSKELIREGTVWNLGIQRGNTNHTHAGQFSLRSDNIQTDSDLVELKVGRIKFIGDDPYTMILHHYYNQEDGLFGTYVVHLKEGKSLVNNVALTDEQKARVDAIFNDVIAHSTPENKINVVYVVSQEFTETNKSPMYEYLSTAKTADGKAYWDYITPQYGVTIKGEEAAYYIVDQNYDGIDKKIVAAEWYTGLTRAKKGSIFVDRQDYTAPFQFKSLEQDQTRNMSIPEEVMNKNTEEYLESLNEIYPEAIPFNKPSGTPRGTTAPNTGGTPPPTPPTPPAPPGRPDGPIVPPPTIEPDPETETPGVMLAEPDSPEITTDGVEHQSEENQASNENSAESNSVMNLNAMGIDYDEDSSHRKVIKRLDYGVYPFRAQRTGYRVNDPSSRDGLQADGYSWCKDDRSDCVYGLRRIRNLLGLDDIYDVEGKTENEKRDIVATVVRTLDKLRNIAFGANSESELLQLFLDTLGMSRDYDVGDVYIREAVIKRNVVEKEPTKFRSVALDFAHELEYGANGTHDGTKASRKNNQVARAEYSLIFGIKDSKQNAHDGKVLLTLPLAGLPNWKTIIQNRKFNQAFRDFVNTLSDKPEVDQAIEFQEYLNKILTTAENIPDENYAQAAVLKDVVDAYLNISNTVTFIKNNRILLSKRFKSHGPFIINNNRGFAEDGKPPYVDGFELFTTGVHSKIAEEATKPQWHFSHLYVPLINKDMQQVRIYKKDGTNNITFKQGSPYVFVTNGEDIPLNVRWGSMSISEGSKWTDELMLEYYIAQLNNPNLPKLVKKIAVDAPGVTVEEYIQNLRSVIYFKGTQQEKEELRRSQDMGNAFTSYRIIQKLYQAYGKEPTSAFYQLMTKANQSRLLRNILGWKTNEDRMTIFKKLQKLSDLENKYRNNNEYVPKIMEELRSEHTNEYTLSNGSTKKISLKWFTIFNLLLYETVHPTLMMSVTGTPLFGAEPAKTLLAKLTNEIKTVTESWKSQTGDSDEVIHYNTFFDGENSTYMGTTSDGYVIDFRKITNVDNYSQSEPSYTMHGKHFTFLGVLIAGPASGDVASMFSDIKQSLKLSMEDLGIAVPEKLKNQKNSKDTFAYDKAHTEGGSVEVLRTLDKSSLIDIWDYERDKIEYNEEDLTEIENIINIARLEPKETTIKTDPITGKTREVLVADEMLRDAGFITTYESNSDGSIKNIKIAKIPEEYREALQDYKLESMLRDPFRKRRGEVEHQRTQILEKIERNLGQTPLDYINDPDNPADPDEALILAFRNKNTNELKYVIAKTYVNEGKLNYEFKFPGEEQVEQSFVIPEDFRESMLGAIEAYGVELSDLDVTGVTDINQLYERVKKQILDAGFGLDDITEDDIRREVDELLKRENKNFCAIIIKF